MRASCSLIPLPGNLLRYPGFNYMKIFKQENCIFTMTGRAESKCDILSQETVGSITFNRGTVTAGSGPGVPAAVWIFRLMVSGVRAPAWVFRAMAWVVQAPAGGCPAMVTGAPDPARDPWEAGESVRGSATESPTKAGGAPTTIGVMVPASASAVTTKGTDAAPPAAAADPAADP